MARGKKKEEMSLEEKLEQALVPVEEQPYEVPGNWCWVRLDGLVSIVTGKKDANYGSKNGEYTFFTCASEPIRCGGYSFEGESLLLPGNGANVGQVFYYDGKFEAYQRTYVLQSLADNINLKYLYYQIQGFWEEYNKDKQYGSATNYIKLDNFLNYSVPVAPLAEQQRIVERIESLFAKLDEAKDKVQEVNDAIDESVEAVLYKAFTGQLTKEWRNLVTEIEKWNDTTLSDIVSGLKYGSSEKSDYEYQGIPVLRIPNIGDGIVDFSDIKYMSGELENSSHEVFENDILIIRSNGSRDLVGKCAIVPKLKERYAYASFLIRMKASEKVLPEYLVRYINSSLARVQMFAKAKSSSGIHNINSKELGAIKICVPPIEEQRQILTIIREIVDKEKKAREIAEEVIGNIDRLKKTILSKAFRGELGTNNLDEESAIDLLKEILMES